MTGLIIRNNKLYQVCTSFLSINVWWNSFMFSDKMDLFIRMRTLDNVKHGHTLCLKFGDLFFISLAKQKPVSVLQLKEFYFCFVVSFGHLLLLLLIAFQNRLLNDVHSIVDKKLRWLNPKVRKMLCAIF